MFSEVSTFFQIIKLLCNIDRMVRTSQDSWEDEGDVEEKQGLARVMFTMNHSTLLCQLSLLLGSSIVCLSSFRIPTI